VLLESEGECLVGFQGDICWHGDVNTSLDRTFKLRDTLNSRCLKPHAITNVDSK
jgi:hypothetical protein